jgi:hypothetical protein
MSASDRTLTVRGGTSAGSLPTSFTWLTAATNAVFLCSAIPKSHRSGFNVSTRWRQRYHRMPIRLNLSGNARYLITLKDKKGKWLVIAPY